MLIRPLKNNRTMNRLNTLLFFISLWFSAGLTAQTQVEASVQNLTTNGTNVQFDIFLRTTNANDLLFLEMQILS